VSGLNFAVNKAMSVGGFTLQNMIIDCDSCSLRDLACKDCVVTFFLNKAEDSLDLSNQTTDALELLSSRGIVPPLRYLA
jgi:hypothetical protein